MMGVPTKLAQPVKGWAVVLRPRDLSIDRGHSRGMDTAFGYG